jgi:hypothetical protein
MSAQQVNIVLEMVMKLPVRGLNGPNGEHLLAQQLLMVNIFQQMLLPPTLFATQVITVTLPTITCARNAK